MPDIVGLELIRNRGAWSDHRHLAPQHIHELWEFVQARLPQKPPDAGHARIRGHLVHDIAVFSVCVSVSRDEPSHILSVNPRIIHGMHRAKLQERKGHSVLADSLLTEENRAWRGQLDCDGDDQK